MFQICHHPSTKSTRPRYETLVSYTSYIMILQNDSLTYTQQRYERLVRPLDEGGRCKKNSKSILRFKILKMKIVCPTFFGDGILRSEPSFEFDMPSENFGK